MGGVAEGDGRDFIIFCRATWMGYRIRTDVSYSILFANERHGLMCFRGLKIKADVLLTLITGSKCSNDSNECLILTLGHGSQGSCSSGIVNQSSVLLLGGCINRPKPTLTSKCLFNLSITITQCLK